MAHNRIAYNKVYHSEYGFILDGEDWLVENNEVNRLFMYAPGRKYDDCDYTRFFGKGCVAALQLLPRQHPAEIKTAHVDCIQTFTRNGEIAMDLLFEYNTCFDFHQMCMVETRPASAACGTGPSGTTSTRPIRRRCAGAGARTSSRRPT